MTSLAWWWAQKNLDFGHSSQSYKPLKFRQKVPKCGGFCQVSTLWGFFRHFSLLVPARATRGRETRNYGKYCYMVLNPLILNSRFMMTISNIDALNMQVDYLCFACFCCHHLLLWLDIIKSIKWTLFQDPWLMGRPCYNALNDSKSWVIMLILLKHGNNILSSPHNNYFTVQYLFTAECIRWLFKCTETNVMGA